jgi:hypothetical protein
MSEYTAAVFEDGPAANKTEPALKYFTSSQDPQWPTRIPLVWCAASGAVTHYTYMHQGYGHYKVSNVIHLKKADVDE